MAAFGFATPQPQQQATGLFGAPAAASPSPFGAAAPAFGATAAPAFGAPASATAFGAPASTPAAFGAASTPSLFGAASAPGFGAASAPAFGAASTPSLFGGASAPAFGAPSTGAAFSFTGASAPAAGSAFAFNAASAPAAGSAFAFNTPAAQSAPALGFGAAAGAAQPGQQPSAAITYSTRYDDMQPAAQQALEAIGKEVISYREDCDKLDRDARLHDSLALKKSLEEETSTLKQSLQGMLNAVKSDEEALSDFKEKVHRLMRATESAVRTYQRSRLWREAPQQYKAGQLVPPGVQELLSSPVILPSPYLEQAIEGFQGALEAYRQCVSELEQALPGSADAMAGANGGGIDEASLVRTLPLVVSHMHDFFVHVAAKMEKLHAEVQRSRDQFLAQRRAAGDYTDPFEEARRYSEQASASSSAAAAAAAAHGHHHGHHGVPHTPAGAGQPGAGQMATPGLNFTPPAAAGSPFGGTPGMLTWGQPGLDRQNTAPTGGSSAGRRGTSGGRR